jgi:hypothetical protein
MEPLKKYRVINRPLVEMLTRQVGSADRPSVEYETGATAGLFGSTLRFTRKSSRRAGEPDYGDPAVVENLVAELRDRGQLRIDRPYDSRSLRDTEWYVYERVEARPFAIAVPETLKRLGAPNAITVWLSGPLAAPAVHTGRWASIYAYLYIVEEISDYTVGDRLHGISGISALNVLLDEVIQQAESVSQYYVRTPPEDDLRRAGAIPGTTRWIETVYKVAYIGSRWPTREGGGDIFKELLAYPLYIAD